MQSLNCIETKLIKSGEKWGVFSLIKCIKKVIFARKRSLYWYITQNTFIICTIMHRQRETSQLCFSMWTSQKFIFPKIVEKLLEAVRANAIIVRQMSITYVLVMIYGFLLLILRRIQRDLFFMKRSGT